MSCRWGVLLLVTANLCIAGCGDAPPPSSEIAPAFDVLNPPAAYVAGEVPETPDLAVKTVIAGLHQQRPEALWHFLPASYQQDVNDVIHEFANRMDLELWDRIVGSLGKLATTVKKQKDFVRASIVQQANPGGPGPAGFVDVEGLADLLGTLVQSDLGSLGKLKKADGGQILAVTGGQFLRQLQSLSKLAPRDPAGLSLDELLQVKVSVVSTAGDSAVLRIEPPGKPPTESEFVRVEGKWIPLSLANGWIEFIGEAKAKLSLLSEENLAQSKPQWLALLTAFDGALEQIAAARTKEQFDGALQGLFLPATMVAGMIQAGAAAEEPAATDPEESPPTADNLVTIVVHGKLNPAERESLLEKFKGLADSSDGTFGEFTGDDELTSFQVGPVADLEELVKQLDFLDDIQVDPAERKVTGRPRP